MVILTVRNEIHLAIKLFFVIFIFLLEFIFDELGPDSNIYMAIIKSLEKMTESRVLGRELIILEPVSFQEIT